MNKKTTSKKADSISEILDTDSILFECLVWAVVLVFLCLLGIGSTALVAVIFKLIFGI